jgi:hypothetical protein
MTAYALRRRALLKAISQTGDARCHHCRRKAPSWNALEVDHVHGKSWVSRKVNSWQRLRIMEREHAEGLKRGVVVLVPSCGHCNHSSGATRRYRWRTRRRRNRGGAGYSNYAVGYVKHCIEEREREEARREAEQQAA